MTWIVTWILTQMVSAPCPMKSQASEFGEEPMYRISCAVMHYREQVDTLSRTFPDSTTAYGFVDRAKNNGSVKIISIKPLK